MSQTGPVIAEKANPYNMYKQRCSLQIMWSCLSILLCCGQDVAAALHAALVNVISDGEKQEENMNLLD